jgi:hypothetical protein
VRYTLLLLVTLAICFTAQSLALRVVGGRTIKSESNYFSSLARIQSGARGESRIMFLGSSITGRLPDKKDGFTDIANIGCDGSSAVDALRAMDKGLLPAAPLLIIEGNTLFLGIGGKDTEISKAIRSPWFAAGVKFQSVGATARPAAFAYSELLAKKIGSAARPDGPRVILSSEPFIPAANSISLTNMGEQNLVDELAKIIARLSQRGTKCWVVIFPPKIDTETPQHNLVRALAAKAGVPFWDLGTGIPSEKVILTDGIHMAPESAAICVREILREVNSSYKH